MNLVDLTKNKTVVTTVSMPLCLYAQILSRAKSERVSLSEIVRQALFREFEKTEKEQKDLGED